MPSKRVRLYIDSDASGVQKGVGQAQRSLKGFESSAKRTNTVMGGLSSSASSLGLALGAGGLALGIKSSIDAFKEQEKSTAKVIAQLKTLGVNTAAVRKQIEDTTKAQSKLSGFQDEELQASFTSILRVTGDVNQSLKLNALAMDISRGSGKGLGVVATALSKVLDGNVGALGRYGVKAQKGASITDVLALAQKRYAGQAREFGNTTAGAADKANAQINELQESIGGKLAPALNAAAGETISLANATQNLVDHAGGIGPVVAGAGGFGAFKLLGPSLSNAGSALGSLGKVAGEKGVGRSFRVLGSAIGSSVTPMGAAAVGAGILAAGIYEIYHQSENADQAVQGLNEKIKGLNSALDQTTAAKDAVKGAQDYVKSTKDAENAARARAAALHADIVQLKEHKGSEAQVEAATKKWKNALDDVIPTVHAHQRATHELDTAQKNLRTSQDGVNVAAGEQNRKMRDVVEKAQHAADNINNMAKSARGAVSGLKANGNAGNEFARVMDKAAAATHRSDRAISTADTNLAGFARHVQRLPTIREMKLVTKYTSQGLSLDEIKRKIDLLNSKTIAVRVRTTFGNAPNPITGLSPAQKKAAGLSTGGIVPGSYSSGDVQPAMLSGEEAVLNPSQISLVDSGMSVMDALRATGAPTDGGFYAPGKQPARYVRSNLTGVKRTTPGVGAQAAAAIERRKTYFNLQLARSDQALANAQGTETIDDDLLAYSSDSKARTAYRDWLGRVLKNPGKTLGFPSYRLSAQQRTDLISEQTAQTRAINDDARAVFDLMNPDNAAGDSTGGDGGGAGTSEADQEAAARAAQEAAAIIEQKQRAIDVLTRSNQLGEAALRGFGSSGDIGTGNFANAMSAAKGGPTLVLADARSLAAVAGAAAQGFGNQPSVSANAASVRV